MVSGLRVERRFLAATSPAGSTGHGELEVLTFDRCEVYYVATDDTALVTLAQRIAADVTRRFAADRVFDRVVSHACSWCPTFGW